MALEHTEGSPVHTLGVDYEHVQKNYLDIAFTKARIDLMKGIKQVFDPNGILNPGKIFPDTTPVS